jgi:hypothetical protein
VINDERQRPQTSQDQDQTQLGSNHTYGEPFFGSDRWHFMYDYLGVPYQDIRILPPGVVGPNDKSGKEKEKMAKL